MGTDFNPGEVHRKVSFLLADFTELLLVIGFEGYKQLHKNDLDSIVSDTPFHIEELDEQLNEDDDSSTISDNQEQCYEDCWSQFEYRAASFKDLYPFEVDGQTLKIKSQLSAAQRIYCFLLCVSRLKSFDKTHISRWASNFTEISKYAMKGLLPVDGKVYSYDANSSDRRNIFGTDNRKALVKLGEMLAVDVIEQRCKEQSPSGDSGLDLVGIVPFKDNALGCFSLFGQCAARERDWPSKTLESHPVKFAVFFSFGSTPTNIMFISVCYRKANGSWENSANSSGCLLIDRMRIMDLLERQNLFTKIAGEDWFQEFENTLCTYSASLP